MDSGRSAEVCAVACVGRDAATTPPHPPSRLRVMVYGCAPYIDTCTFRVSCRCQSENPSESPEKLGNLENGCSSPSWCGPLEWQNWGSWIPIVPIECPQTASGVTDCGNQVNKTTSFTESRQTGMPLYLSRSDLPGNFSRTRFRCRHSVTLLRDYVRGRRPQKRTP